MGSIPVVHVQVTPARKSYYCSLSNSLRLLNSMPMKVAEDTGSIPVSSILSGVSGVDSELVIDRV